MNALATTVVLVSLVDNRHISYNLCVIMFIVNDMNYETMTSYPYNIQKPSNQNVR